MAAESTYTPIATNTLGSATGSVTFSSISGSYTDLVVIINAKASNLTNSYCRVNGDSGTNYSSTFLSGTGSVASSARATNNNAINVEYQSYIDTSNFDYIARLNFMNYSNSTTYKTVLQRADNSTQAADSIVSLWRSTSAITSIEFFLTSGRTFAVGSTFTLYGIQAA